MRKSDAEYQRSWRERNPERNRENQKRTYERNKERIKLGEAVLWQQTQPGETDLQRIERVWSRTRARMKAKGCEFTILFSDVSWPTHCPVLGMELDYSNGCSENGYSLDRLDCNKGYIPGNVHVISRRANRIKNDATILELEQVIAWMRKTLA